MVTEDIPIAIKQKPCAGSGGLRMVEWDNFKFFSSYLIFYLKSAGKSKWMHNLLQLTTCRDELKAASDLKSKFDELQKSYEDLKQDFDRLSKEVEVLFRFSDIALFEIAIRIWPFVVTVFCCSVSLLLSVILKIIFRRFVGQTTKKIVHSIHQSVSRCQSFSTSLLHISDVIEGCWSEGESITDSCGDRQGARTGLLEMGEDGAWAAGEEPHQEARWCFDGNEEEQTKSIEYRQ